MIPREKVIERLHREGKTPREKGIERLNREANKATLAGYAVMLFSMLIGLILGLVISINEKGIKMPEALFGFLAFAGFSGAGWAGLRELLGQKKRRLLEIERLKKAAPFYEAYRSGRTTFEALPQKSDERQRLRETYHQLKEAIEAQLKTHKEEKEFLQNNGKIEDAQGMAALILDLEDAEKQLQKELSIIERSFHPVQTPHVAAEPSPVGRIDPASETGLEEY